MVDGRGGSSLVRRDWLSSGDVTIKEALMKAFIPLRRRLTYANVMATVAFFFALTGASMAGVKYIAAGDAIPATSDLAGSYGDPKIADGKVTTDKVADGAITSSKIASNAVTSGALAVGSVSGGALAGKVVTSEKIAEGAIVGEKLANDSVASWNIKANAVITSSIAEGAVDTADIASDAVTSSQIADGSVTGADISYTRVQNSTDINGDDYKNVTVECPGGKVVSGGGFQMNGTTDDMHKVTVLSSQPLTPPGSEATKWAVDAEEIAGQEATTWGITVFAVCT